MVICGFKRLFRRFFQTRGNPLVAKEVDMTKVKIMKVIISCSLMRSFVGAFVVLALGSFVTGCAPSQPKIQTISRTTRYYPEDPKEKRVNELMELARLQLKAGHPSAYVSNLEEAYAIQPKNRILIAYLAQYYGSHGEEVKALPLYRETVAARVAESSLASDPIILTEWAELELKHGSPGNAREGFRRAVEQLSLHEKGGLPWPKFSTNDLGMRAKAHYVSGLEYHVTGRYEAALSEYQTAHKLVPSNEELKYLIAWLFEKECKPPRAQEALDLYRTIPDNTAAGPAARKAQHRLEYYWKMWHTWNPMDLETRKQKIWNPKSGRFELPASK